MEHIMRLILGLFISAIGIINIKGNISTVHSYNRKKIKEEDIPKYGKAVGTGTLIIGAAIALSSLTAFWNETLGALLILPAVIIGFGFILYGQFKYNGGLF